METDGSSVNSSGHSLKSSDIPPTPPISPFSLTGPVRINHKEETVLRVSNTKTKKKKKKRRITFDRNSRPTRLGPEFP